MHLSTLLRFIQPWDDDAWYVSRALALNETGHTFGALDTGVLNNFPGHENYFWFIGTWLDSLFLKVFGPDLFALRLRSFLFGMILLGIVYILARRFYSPRVGLLAILIGAFSYSFIDAAHVGRGDVIVAVLGFGAIALYLYQDDTRFTLRSVMSGLALGIAFDIHPIVIVYPPVIAALLLMDYRLAAFRLGRTWGFALGLACGLVYFAAIHILPNPQTYFAISSIQQGRDVTTIPIAAMNLQVLFDSFSALVTLIKLPVVLLVVCASVVLVRFGGRSDLRFVLIFDALFVSMGLLVPLKPFYYGIIIAPMAWLVLAAGADLVLPKGDWRTARWAALRLAFVTLVLGALTVVNAPLLIRDHYGDYQAAMQLVSQNVPSGKSIIGPMTYWLARPGQPYFAWEQFSYYRRYYPGSTVEDSLKGMHPDYLVLDGLAFENFLSDDPSALSNNVMVEKSKLMEFLNEHATLVAQQWSLTYGSINIYKIDW